MVQEYHTNKRHLLIVELHDYTTNFKESVLLYRLPKSLFTSEFDPTHYNMPLFHPPMRTHIDVISPAYMLNELIDTIAFLRYNEGSNHEKGSDDFERCALMCASHAILPQYDPFFNLVSTVRPGKFRPTVDYNENLRQLTLQTQRHWSDLTHQETRYWIGYYGPQKSVEHSWQDKTEFLMNMGTMAYVSSLLISGLITDNDVDYEEETSEKNFHNAGGFRLEWDLKKINLWIRSIAIRGLFQNAYTKGLELNVSSMGKKRRRTHYLNSRASFPGDSNFSLDFVFYKSSEQNYNYESDSTISVTSQRSLISVFKSVASIVFF